MVIRPAPRVCCRAILITDILGICWLTVKASACRFQSDDCLIKTRELINVLQPIDSVMLPDYKNFVQVTFAFYTGGWR